MRAAALRYRRAAVKNGASCATPLADLCPVRNACPLETLSKGLCPLAPARGLPSLLHCAALRLCRPRVCFSRRLGHGDGLVALADGALGAVACPLSMSTSLHP